MIDAEIRTQLIEIEMMLAHQQKAIDELSEMVIKHGKVIDHLQKQTDITAPMWIRRTRMAACGDMSSWMIF